MAVILRDWRPFAFPGGSVISQTARGGELVDRLIIRRSTADAPKTVVLSLDIGEQAAGTEVDVRVRLQVTNDARSRWCGYRNRTVSPGCTCPTCRAELVSLARTAPTTGVTPAGFNVFSAISVVAAATPDATTGTEVSRAGGLNVTPDIHHYTHVRAEFFTVTAPTCRFLNLVAYASASRAAYDDTSWLYVDRTYGRIQAAI